MSVEDSGSDFLSDESDYEAEEKLDDGETDVEEFSYAAMVRLHHNLINFQNIYIYNINAVIAIEVGKLIIISTDLFVYNFSQPITNPRVNEKKNMFFSGTLWTRLGQTVSSAVCFQRWMSATTIFS